jgi:putative ABC transport system permease protein
MTIWRLVLHEILHRKGSFFLSVVSVGFAVATLIGAVALLKSHDARTQQILEEQEQELKVRMGDLNEQMRKTMLKLGFNVVILPAEQELSDWYSNDYASKYMPEEYVMRLADSGIVTVRHFLPSLQQKITWPERKRTIILIGTRGEVPNLHKNRLKPLVQPVPDGTIVLGHELHQSLELKVNDTVQLMGREFTVSKCHAERGSKDDITAWVSLKSAQELLDKKDKINAILALECLCAGVDALARIRKEIAAILPGTRVIEHGSKVIARAESRARVYQEATALIEAKMAERGELRRTRGQLASLLVPVIMIACGAWVSLLGFTNVKTRQAEIGVLRAIGLRSRQIMVLFLAKSVLIGIGGGVLGFLVGTLVGSSLGVVLEGLTFGSQSLTGLRDISSLGLAIAIASALTVIAGWIPATIASRQDPAVVLRKE